MFRHPKYYKELRKRNKAARIPPTSSGQAASDQAISFGTASTDDAGVRPGPGQQHQASSDKLKEPQASSGKHQAPSSKRQA